MLVLCVKSARMNFIPFTNVAVELPLVPLVFRQDGCNILQLLGIMLNIHFLDEDGVVPSRQLRLFLEMFIFALVGFTVSCHFCGLCYELIGIHTILFANELVQFVLAVAILCHQSVQLTQFFRSFLRVDPADQRGVVGAGTRLPSTVDGVELGLHDAVEVVSNISIEYGARHCCGLPVTTIDFHPSTRSREVSRVRAVSPARSET